MTEPSRYFKGRTVQEQMNEVIGYVDTRAAEVATAAIASDVAQVHQDMLDADADASAAAASAAAAAGTLANAVKKTGESNQSIAGDIAVAGDVGVGGDLSVTGTATVQAPVNNTDAATKKYVDDADALKISINDVNSYAVGLTGNQTNISGTKIFVNECSGTAYYGLTNKKTSFTKGDRTTNNRAWFGLMKDANDNSLIRGFYDNNADGTNQIVFSAIVDVNGTATSIELLRVVTNASGVVTTIAVGGRILQ